jgi:hypothetical protein
MQTFSNPSAGANRSTNCLLFMWPDTNRFSTATQVFASDGLARRFGAHLASTPGPVFAENLLRH